ncbi:hypothetical protein HRbin02_00991 [Candidatus Calditenuaceae archaeon HR02]|nr:hypothetical protein HRbin02_00991 [Candidatus Calditenuaceae archaeon HR02]
MIVETLTVRYVAASEGIRVSQFSWAGPYITPTWNVLASLMLASYSYRD